MLSDFIETIRNVNTRRAYVRALNHFIAHLNGACLLSATRKDVEAYIDSLLDKGRSVATINAELAAIKAYFAWWESLDETYRSPASLVRPLPAPVRAPKALPERDVHILVRTAFDVVRRIYEECMAGESDLDAIFNRDRSESLKRAKVEIATSRLRLEDRPRAVDEENEVPRFRVISGNGRRFALSCDRE